MKYTIEIPDELNKYMVEGGWDVQAYIKQVLLDPLVKRFENEKKTTILSAKLAEVDASVKEIHAKAEVKNFEEEKTVIQQETVTAIIEANPDVAIVAPGVETPAPVVEEEPAPIIEEAPIEAPQVVEEPAVIDAVIDETTTNTIKK